MTTEGLSILKKYLCHFTCRRSHQFVGLILLEFNSSVCVHFNLLHSFWKDSGKP